MPQGLSSVNLNENAIITDLSYTNKIDITDGTTYHVVLYLQSRHLIRVPKDGRQQNDRIKPPRAIPVLGWSK